MLPKLNNCTDAIIGGVNRVHILDGRKPHTILLEFFTKKGIGTMFFRDSDTDVANEV
jgi:acetylglutamate kinase